MPRPKSVRGDEIGLCKTGKAKPRKKRVVTNPYGTGSAAFWKEPPGVDVEAGHATRQANMVFDNMEGRLQLFARRAEAREPVARKNDTEAMLLEWFDW